MRWIYKKHAGQEVTRCPFCNKIIRGHVEHCDRCNGIFDESSIRLLNSLAKKLRLDGRI